MLSTGHPGKILANADWEEWCVASPLLLKYVKQIGEAIVQESVRKELACELRSLVQV